MPSLYNSLDNTLIRERILSLAPESKPLWGKMNVVQMFVHCRKPLQYAVGELKAERKFLYKLIGGIAKKLLVNDKPFRKNMPTDASLIITTHEGYTYEQTVLLQLVQRFSDEGEKIVSDRPHPLFGAMTSEEWSILQWKHLDHHLRQFGA